MAASLPGSTKGGGMCQAMPDVCKVPAPPLPPIPTPFPNMGQLMQAQKASTKVKFFLPKKLSQWLLPSPCIREMKPALLAESDPGKTWVQSLLRKAAKK